ncbi:hypothetical protein [Vibrio ezurae]|uniref:hypothetical protein n=1 Tax=Vibrio ezurae TaxID=252583 RepID=UPI000413BE67|nr:hypothetical protein [Vibrio ezurae]
MIKKFLVVLSISLLAGCTHNQVKALSLNTSSVNTYPQNMTDLQLCDTLYFGRPSNQTLAAIGSEFNRRKLSKSWCLHVTNRWYLTRTYDWLVQPYHEHEKEHHS